MSDEEVEKDPRHCWRRNPDLRPVRLTPCDYNRQGRLRRLAPVEVKVALDNHGPLAA
jgi:hypothetical protein